MFFRGPFPENFFFRAVVITWNLYGRDKPLFFRGLFQMLLSTETWLEKKNLLNYGLAFTDVHTGFTRKHLAKRPRSNKTFTCNQMVVQWIAKSETSSCSSLTYVSLRLGERSETLHAMTVPWNQLLTNISAKASLKKMLGLIKHLYCAMYETGRNYCYRWVGTAESKMWLPRVLHASVPRNYGFGSGRANKGQKLWSVCFTVWYGLSSGA